MFDDTIINFVVTNYKWIMIIGAVIFMILVGYIAETTDFGRNIEVEPKKKKENKKEINEEK